MGCNLPRHKRVDFQIANHSEKDLLTFLATIGEFKNVTMGEENICTVEFLTALGAARAIVHTKTNLFFGQRLVADYSPSTSKEGQGSECESQTTEASTQFGSLHRRQREHYLSEQFGTRDIVNPAALQEAYSSETYFQRNRTMSLGAIGSDSFSKFSNTCPVNSIETYYQEMRRLCQEPDQLSLFGVPPKNIVNPRSYITQEPQKYAGDNEFVKVESKPTSGTETKEE